MYYSPHHFPLVSAYKLTQKDPLVATHASYTPLQGSGKFRLKSDQSKGDCDEIEGSLLFPLLWKMGLSHL